MKKLSVKITCIVLAIIVAFASVFSLWRPSRVEAVSATTETELKKIVFGIAFVNNCLSSNDSLRDAAVGNNIGTVLAWGDMRIEVGALYGGTTTCAEALKTVVGSSVKLAVNQMDAGILKGVYTLGTTSEKRIQCSYYIVNYDETAFYPTKYTWPQGYYFGYDGDYVDKTGVSPLWVVYNEDGPIRIEGNAGSDMYNEHALESLKNRIIDWSNDGKICVPLTMYTEIYGYTGFNEYTQQNQLFYEDLWAGNDEGDPLDGNAFINLESYQNRAWLYIPKSNSSLAAYAPTHYVESVQSTSQLVRTSDAAQAFKDNIMRMYLNGKDDLGEYLNADANAKYLYYGRYLFNGDGQFFDGCGGTTVSKSDPNYSTLDQQFWSTSLASVAEVSAFDSGTATSKSDYITKFGGNGLNEIGSAKSVYFPAGPSSGTDCKNNIAVAFNSISGVTNAGVKNRVLEYMGVAAVEELPEQNDPNYSDPNSSDPNSSSSGIGNRCFEAAQSLGWILCPVLSGLGNMITGVYSLVDNTFLAVDSDLLSTTNTSSSTYDGWKIFRNFANTLFAIALVFVILSQVTGIGVSNYGVKKILPRLIMVAILVNLSFIICQICADLSNILGESLFDLLNGMAKPIIQSIGIASDGENVVVGVVGGIMQSLFSTAVTGGIIAGIVAGLVMTWEFWLFPLIIVLIGCLIGILFFFITLGVRQAGIIILIVLSPLAIVCYALPNTKALFDKWKKAFAALLLAYPICGLLMGGGQFASALLVKAGNNAGDKGFLYMLTAILISVVPFFFIPSIIKGSMAGLGNLGMKISGLGQRLGGRLGGAIRNSESGRDAQRRLDMRNAEKTVNRLNRRETRLNARGRDLNPRDLRRRAAATARYNRAAYEDIKAGGSQELLTPGSLAYTSAMGGQRSRELADQVAGQEALYANNPDMQTIAELEEEHGRLLTELDANPEDMQLEAQMRAVQNVMMKRGDGGKDAIQRSLMNHLGQLQADGRAYDYDATTGRGERTGASVAAAHLSTAHGQTFKNENREMFNLVNDLSERQYRNSHENGGFVETAPGSGQFASQYYRGRGANGWKAETLAGSTAGTQANILHGIRSGAISGQSLRNLATTARSALRDERLASTMNDETVANLRSIVAADAATDAQTWDDSAPYRPTAGSTVVSGMDAETLHDMADHIESLDMTQADSQVQAQQIAENVYRAMMNPDVSYDPAKMQAMQGVLAAANRQGVQRMMTGTGPGVRFSEVDPATLRLVHTRPMAMPPAPEGYDEHGAWTGTLGTETDDHRTAREEWQRETARRRMYNQENGFNPDGSRPTPPPSPPPPGGP